MRDRWIDTALIVGLVAIAGAIVWTLFSLGGDRGGPGPDRGTISDTTTPGAGIVPIAPDGSSIGDAGPDGASGSDAASSDADALAGTSDAGPGGGSDGAASTTDADATASGDADGSADDDVAGSTGGGPLPDRPDPEIAAVDAPPLPENGFAEVGRVGFSFVTGGAGACGIVLEPWTHVAVSRELLSAYGCGAEVTLTLDESKDGRTTVQAIVGDTMNESFSRTVNVYVGQDEPALQYGLTTGTIQPR